MKGIGEKEKGKKERDGGIIGKWMRSKGERKGGGGKEN